MSLKEYIDQAIKDGRSITISYVKYGGEFSTRKISDIKYSDEFGPDYISAYCHLRNENRTFKISRIQKVDGITFSKPTGPVVTNGHITQNQHISQVFLGMPKMPSLPIIQHCIHLGKIPKKVVILQLWRMEITTILKC